MVSTLSCPTGISAKDPQSDSTASSARSDSSPSSTQLRSHFRNHLTRRRANGGGFSIIEVVVALAILALVGIGLIQGFLFMHRQSYALRDHTATTDYLRSLLAQAQALPYAVDRSGGSQTTVPEILKTPNDAVGNTTPPASFNYGAGRDTFTPRFAFNGTIYGGDGWATLSNVPIYISANPARNDLTTAQAVPYTDADLRRRVTVLPDPVPISEDRTMTESNIRVLELELTQNKEAMSGQDRQAIRVVTFRASSN
ncbi:MAG: type II secretion system protein J [Verrucomicrobiales bacterium]